MTMLKDEIASGGQTQGQKPAIPALEAEAGWFQARMDSIGTQNKYISDTYPSTNRT